MAEVKHMTADEFLALPETNQPMELIKGQIVMSPGPRYPHQAVVFELAIVIRALIPDGKVILSPQDLHIDEDTVLQPDIFWVRPAEPRCELVDGYWFGVPALAVEVLSPGTAKRDRGEKYDIYEQAGVREYWLVEPQGVFVEVYQHEGERFQRVGAFDSPLLGRVELATVFDEEEPW